jgi:hypothetical protein
MPDLLAVVALRDSGIRDQRACFQGIAISSLFSAEVREVKW